MFDLHIVGAGPTGCIAAIAALREGKKVLISEEHSSAGGKPCTGLFSLSGLKTLKKYVNWQESVENEIYGADIYFGNECITVAKKTPIAVVCNRQKFDRILASMAEDEGAKLKYKDRVVGSYEASTIIGADGAFSSTADFFKFPKISQFVGTMQGEVRANWDEQKVKVFFSSSFPGFLGWVVPRGQRLFEIGCGVRLPFNVNNSFQLLERKLDVKALNKKAYVIPLDVRKSTAKKINRYDVRLVGDAAGQVKPTTGGGVLFGCWCAEIAATAKSSFDYELKWRFKYQKQLFLHNFIRSFLNKKTDAEMELKIKILKKNNIEEFLSKYGDMEFLGNLFKHALVRPSFWIALF
ncbi:MAG: FAD-dependent oxidoreductase [Candidatus Bilamarchaeaceae archaeon]